MASRARPRAWLKPVLVAAASAMLVALLGATVTELGPWYRSLQQPTWAPPDWLYGAAWTLIYLTTSIAGILAWRATPRARDGEWLIGLFALNGALNIGWSLLFFRAQRPDWALAEVMLLWLSIVLLMVTCRRYSRRSAWLLVPYLAWVSVAAALNLAVVRLNPPFG